MTTPDAVYVVRTSLSDASLLGIDRDAEAANTRLAAEAGVGAEVVDHRPGALTITFLEGQALAGRVSRRRIRLAVPTDVLPDLRRKVARVDRLLNEAVAPDREAR